MENKKNILWISPYAPYDKVAHGGGKTHNFYVKYLHKTKKFHITLLSICLKSEQSRLDLDKYGIEHSVFVMDQTKMKQIIRRAVSSVAFLNPFDPYGGGCLTYERRHMVRMIKGFHKRGQTPDIVILQWTFSLMLIDEIKKYFPESVIVAIEEDVTFLNYERRMAAAKGIWNRFFWRHRFGIMKEAELKKLEKADFIVTNNQKDTELLTVNGLTEKKIFTAAPYFDSYINLQRKKTQKDVIFFGAMSRAENYKSAIWFVENVMPLLKDQEIRFRIIGGEPDHSLYRYESERVIIEGYVEDMERHFGSCMCMAAPLVGGAGIKIKVLEAMSAGVPVLTNDVGIEGIAATDQKEYLHCTRAEEYGDYINQIADGSYDTSEISENAKQLIIKNYDLQGKLNKLINMLDEAC